MASSSGAAMDRMTTQREIKTQSRPSSHQFGNLAFKTKMFNSLTGLKTSGTKRIHQDLSLNKAGLGRENIMNHFPKQEGQFRHDPKSPNDAPHFRCSFIMREQIWIGLFQGQKVSQFNRKSATACGSPKHHVFTQIMRDLNGSNVLDNLSGREQNGNQWNSPLFRILMNKSNIIVKSSLDGVILRERIGNFRDPRVPNHTDFLPITNRPPKNNLNKVVYGLVIEKEEIMGGQVSICGRELRMERE
ncbi:hypothetical protein Acr_21g0005740 [Actinidia rufa]|uniref:Uncharacterized protein n=1 Tax=Actinidia rufa TaxID=165716 RepID=A0A7J0GGR8_9ERIC|nr:hypothetical protein Acr_21g0005740 [Actinidia rufa]